MKTASEIFDRYEAIRHRLPGAELVQNTSEISSLLDISDQADAFIFDAYGVLNVGETAIPGAAERLDQLRERGCEIRILSNAASYDHEGAIKKFRNLGIQVESNEIITSRDAALAELPAISWGCIATPTDRLTELKSPFCRLGDDPQAYDDVEGFLFLSSLEWTTQRQGYLEQSLRNNPRPLVIANPDLVAPREGAFSLEPGFFGHLLADCGIKDIRFFGKPFGDVYELLEASLPNIAANRIVMCGDTLHTDIIGAAAQGWRTVLISRDGLFAGHDTKVFCKKSSIHPDWRSPRI